jgi:hypothetical protein
MGHLAYLVQKNVLGLRNQLFPMLMLAVSLVLHSVLLVLPMPPEPKPKPKKEEEVVKITSLVAAASPTETPTPKAAEPSPKEAPKPKAQSKPKSTAARPPQVEPPLQVDPDPEPPKNESPSEEPTQNEPPPNDPPPEEPPPAPPPGPAGASAEEIEAFLGSLRSKILENLRADPSAIGSAGGAAEDFAEIEAYLDSLPFDQLAIDPAPFGSGEQLKPGALGSLALPRVNFSTAREKVSEVLSGVGFSQIEDFGEYGGASLLKAKNSYGAELYVSLVKQKLGAGVFVVLWPQDPNTL